MRRKSAKMKKILLGITLCVLILFPLSVQAIPELIALPVGGTYQINPLEEIDPWMEYVIDDFVVTETDSSGVMGGESQFTVIIGANSVNQWDPALQVYLYTNLPNGDQCKFDEMDFLSVEHEKKFSAYHFLGETGIYHRVDLGSVDTNPSKWVEITDPAFEAGIWYEYTASYSGPTYWPPETAYLFAVAETIDKKGNPVYTAAPKTSSTTVVPEPTSMALLGFGLLCMAGFKKRKKEKEV